MIMKKLIFAVFFLLSAYAYADYSTPGTGVSWNLDNLVANSGGAVTFSSGMYFINDNLIITSPDTIKILNNSTVKLAYNIVFNTLGTLIINPPDSVKFTSADTTQKFNELRLDDLSDASILRKLIFEYSFNGLRILDSNPLIDQCTFRYNCGGNSSTTVPAINLFRSNAVISNCKIYRNYKVAIGGGANIANAPQILNNEIYENNIANGNVPQINLGQSGSGTTVIRGNTIRGLYTNAGGIATLPIGTLSIVIENNIIKNNRYGIALASANTTAVIRNNIIDSNNIQGNPNLGGSGINFNGNATIVALVSKNTIRGNLWGITIQGTAKPVMGDLSIPDTNYIGLNSIYNNGNNDSTYDLYNNTPDSIKAENNWWGTGDPGTIELHIFHKPDNPSLGFVDYVPFLAVLPAGNNHTAALTEYRLYNAYPNPFNPVTNIKFDIPGNAGNLETAVSLKIYDVTGRLVEVLLNSEMTPGSYKVTFNGTNLSSGVYFYVFSAQNYTISKKVVLAR